MSRRAEELQTESEAVDADWGPLTALMKDGYGEGTAERGAVTVRVDANQRVIDISLTAKAIHLGSTDKLRRALLDAIDAACEDMSTQLSKAAGIEGPYSPLDAFIGALPEVAEVLPAELRHPPRRRRPEPGDLPESDEEVDA